MIKSFMEETAGGIQLSEEELAQINRLTRRRFTQEEIYAFSVVLCDNEVDRDFERFSVEALETLAPLFQGRTGIFDHSMKGQDQTARIYQTQVKTQADKRTSQGEVYHALTAKAYMPRTARNATLITEIDSGIKKEVSIGCSVGQMTCSVCGADSKHTGCSHTKGQYYGKKLCHVILSEPRDAYEWSFVAVPAQRAAGVTKAYHQAAKGGEGMQEDPMGLLKGAAGSVTLSGEAAQALLQKLEALETEAAAGRFYRQELQKEVLRLSGLTGAGLEPAILAAITDKLDIAELKAFQQAFAVRADRVAPPSVQLKAAGKPEDWNQAEFKI